MNRAISNANQSRLQSGSGTSVPKVFRPARTIVLLAIVLAVAGVGSAAPPTNLALNTSRTGYPSPLASDSGWGGGTDKWEIVDGARGYTDTWAHGLAFTGGHQSAAGGPPWIEPCGVRQATIDFGKLVTFDTVMIWHHGVEYTAAAPWLDYWNGSAWVGISVTTHLYPAGHVDGQGYADAELFGFARVNGSKVRYSMDNCGLNVLGTYNIHGWINEFEVYGAGEFQVNFTTFIQGNSLVGPPQSRCGRGEQLYFAGDDRRPNPSATSFRTRQLVTVITDQSVDIDGVKDGTAPQNVVGLTKSYAPDALPTIDASDDDLPNLLDCHLLHEIGRASNSGMQVSVTRTGPLSLSIHLEGSVGNPLVLGAGALAPIDWDLTLTLDTSGPVTNWTLSGTDDGFPSWELYVNDIPIYIRNAPPPYTSADLRKLLPHIGDIQINTSGQLQ